MSLKFLLTSLIVSIGFSTAFAASNCGSAPTLFKAAPSERDEGDFYYVSRWGVVKVANVTMSLTRSGSWARSKSALPSDVRLGFNAFSPSEQPSTLIQVGVAGLSRSDNGGASFYKPKMLYGGKPLDSSPMVLAGISWSLSPTLFVTVGGRQPGLYKSTDGGDNWVFLTSEIATEPEGVWPAHSALAVDPRDSQHLVASAKQDLLHSSDGGRTWHPSANSSEFSTPVEIEGRNEAVREMRMKGLLPYGDKLSWNFFTASQIVFDQKDPTRVYALTTRGLLLSADGGNRWQRLNVGPEVFGGLTSFDLNPKNSGELIVASRDSVFVSSNSGCSFKALAFNRRKH